MIRRLVVLGAASLALSACADEAPGEGAQVQDASPEVEARAVRVGISGPDLDACAGYGVVSEVPPEGHSVHSAPSSDATEVDRIANEQGVTICEMSGAWLGVVYSQGGDAEVDCETSSPVANVQDYIGPCRSGWVRDGAVEFVAG